MKRIVRSAVLVGMLLGTSGVFAPPRARAEAHRDLDYSYDQVWNTLVRLVRVDYRFPIDERDDATGFLLFQYRDHGRTHAASLELVRAATPASADAGGGHARERVRLVVHIDGMPNRAETRVLTDLIAKLRADYGPPPPAVPDATDIDGAASLRPRLSPAPSRIPTSDVPPAAAEVTPPSATPRAVTTTNPGETAVAPTSPGPRASPSASGAPADRRVYRTAGGSSSSPVVVRDSGSVTAPGPSTEEARARAQGRTGRGDGPRDGVRPSAGPEVESPADAPRVILR